MLVLCWARPVANDMYIKCDEMYICLMTNYSAARAREVFSEVLDQAANEPVFIERRGSVAAVVISPAQYEAMLDALEEHDDIAAFDAAMNDEGSSIPWEQVKADLGWV